MIPLKLKNKLRILRKFFRKKVFTDFYNNIISYKNEANNFKKNYPDFFSFRELLQYLPLWLLKINSDSLVDEKPWIPFNSYRYLKKVIKKDMIIFEYGSGGSTLFFSKMANKVISVEHNNKWYLKVKKRIELINFKNCETFLEEPKILTEVNKNKYNYCDLESYKSSKERYSNMSFEKYVKTIDLYPDSYFDIIFIDGRSRPSCAKHAINKLKVNGYLILDDSQRDSYKKIGEYLDNKHWTKLVFMGPRPMVSWFTQLTIWKKID